MRNAAIAIAAAAAHSSVEASGRIVILIFAYTNNAYLLILLLLTFISFCQANLRRGDGREERRERMKELTWLHEHQSPFSAAILYYSARSSEKEEGKSNGAGITLLPGILCICCHCCWLGVGVPVPPLCIECIVLCVSA